MTTNRPIRLALIGAGIYARDAHLPALKALGDTFEIVAIYSRTQASAANLARQLPTPPDLYTELEPLLARPDIEALDIVLPIDVMPSIVEKALQSGKHVISEKPIAPDVATGRRLIQAQGEQVWMVAENWRYEDAFMQLKHLLSQEAVIGSLLLCHWPIAIPMTPDNKYYQTEWRRSGTFPGGLLLDTGVHHVAVLRTFMGEIREVSAFITQMRPDLTPADTITATLRFESGLIGSYAVTYAAAAPWPPALHIIGDRGAIHVHRGGLEITTDGITRSLPVNPGKGVENELSAFADAIRHGQPQLNTPETTLQDLAVVEAMLRSAESARTIEIENVLEM
jgi:predicted dehydrogenase